MGITQPPQTKRRLILRNATLALLGAMVLFSAGEALLGVSLADLKLGLLVLLLPLSLLWVETLDEVARQGHYWAWFWGCAGGIAGMTMLAIMVHGGLWHQGVDALLTAWRGEASAQSGFLLGLLTTPVLCVIGFACFWAVYWLRRR
ncbi:MAG TPA: hypothetical protein PLS69_13525 [Terricaulis sp.]|nr:hypothetical protein [Terricaulis sp.]HRP10984.1 hypothetical protein [Terricaulis sp.]